MFISLISGQLKDQADQACGQRVAVRQTAKRHRRHIPLELHRSQSPASQRTASVTTGTRHCRCSVRLHARPTRGPEVPNGRHYSCAIQTERPLVLRRVQRLEGPVPYQLCSNELMITTRLERSQTITYFMFGELQL